MKDIILPPVQSTFISISRPQENFSHDIDLVAGWQSPRSMQRILMQFDLSMLEANAEIVLACLRMYSSGSMNGWGQLMPYLIASDWDEAEVTWDTQPKINTSICGKTKVETATGWYYWDVTNLAQSWCDKENLGLMLVSDAFDIADWKRFDRIDRFGPSLQIQYDETKTSMQDSKGLLNVYETAQASHELSYSSWRNTCTSKVCTFFVKNTGKSKIELHVQISPDECTEYDEAAVYIIGPGETEAIVPQRFAYYTRLAYRTVEPCTKAKLRIWFQAQT